MEISEKELEDIIFNTDNKLLQERGLDIYGIADIITIERSREKNYDVYSMVITVWELKKGQLNIDAFLQAVRYIKAIQQVNHPKVSKHLRKYDHIDYQIRLLGDSVDTGCKAFVYIPEVFGGDKIDMYTYSMDFNGLKFNCELGYNLTNEGLIPSKI